MQGAKMQTCIITDFGGFFGVDFPHPPPSPEGRGDWLDYKTKPLSHQERGRGEGEKAARSKRQRAQKRNGSLTTKASRLMDENRLFSLFRAAQPVSH